MESVNNGRDGEKCFKPIFVIKVEFSYQYNGKDPKNVKASLTDINKVTDMLECSIIPSKKAVMQGLFL